MICNKCKHSWITKSKLILVTCPSCGYKVKNKRKPADKDTSKRIDTSCDSSKSAGLIPTYKETIKRRIER